MATPVDTLVAAHEKVLLTLDQYGLGISTILDDSGELSINNDFFSENFNEQVDNTTACTLLECVKSIHTTLSDLRELCAAAQRIKLQNNLKNLLNVSSLEEWGVWCSKANSALVELSSSRDLLLYYLQQPVIYSSLTMHRKHHSHLSANHSRDIMDTCCAVYQFFCTNDRDLRVISPTSRKSAVNNVNMPHEMKKLLSDLCDAITNTSCNARLFQQSCNNSLHSDLNVCMPILFRFLACLQSVLADLKSFL